MITAINTVNLAVSLKLLKKVTAKMPKQIVGFSLLLISCIYLITFLIKILLFQNQFIVKS